MLNQKDFDYCTALMPRACVDLIFVVNSRVLLMKRIIDPDRGKWGLPGGSIFFGETVEQAAVRKAFEETKFSLSKEQLKLVATATYFFPTRHDVCFVFRIDLANEFVPIFDSQHNDYRWTRGLPENMNREAKKEILRGLL